MITVTPDYSSDGCLLRSDAGDIRVATSHPAAANLGGPADFAAWFFLPVAMRLGRDLHVEGAGHAVTRDNFRTLAEIWRTWLPHHFEAVSCSFAETLVPRKGVSDAPDLLFYSGGADAAFTGLERRESGLGQHLMTVHGMDYALGEDAQFAALMEKTAPFAATLSATRIVVTTDAYALYRRLGVNLRGHHLAHPFALAGAGFFHAKTYDRLVLAADERLDGQVLAHPWGTGSATDRLFSDGRTRFVTHGDDVSRIDKLNALRAAPDALASLSFCWNRTIQPGNCGTCPKCLRSKLLFLADDGTLPPLFLDETIPPDWLDRFAWRTPQGRLAVAEIVDAAARNGTEEAIPGCRAARDEVFGWYRRRHARKEVLKSLRPRHAVRALRRRIRGAGKTGDGRP